MFIALFFFFKQKTAYEMRISDWSSDVCSSDLPEDEVDRLAVGREGEQDAAVHDRRAAVVHELGLEIDRRAAGDDLKIMVGQPRQQRPAGGLADRPDRTEGRRGGKECVWSGRAWGSPEQKTKKNNKQQIT